MRETSDEPIIETNAPPLPPLPREWQSLPRAFLDAARRRHAQVAMADSMGTQLTYADVLMRSVALGRVLSRSLGHVPYVGVMIPPTVPAAVANVALALKGKIPVNLNYSASEEIVNSAIAQCGITHVLTSRRAIAKFQIKPNAELIYLEDIPKQVTPIDKAFAAASRVLPRALLASFLPGLRSGQLEEPATVIFTSGSTGDPKGVVLTHRNVLSNMLGIKTHVYLNDDDVLLGILPFFHSFGFTVTLWTVLGLGLKGVYHVSPLDSRIVGHLCAEHHATVLAATPTFMRGYMQRCKAEDFASVRLLILGAEKLKQQVASEIRERFRIEPLEGYGCTETGPVVSVNRPFDVPLPDGRRVAGNRPGTVGQLLPGTQMRTIDPESGAPLPRGHVGMIQVKGPQVMVGYLNKPDATRQVLQDGWYSTGDLGYVDEDGFLRITDRLSRFSKIGGELVSHLAVENGIIAACGHDSTMVCVAAIPDSKRGERLVVVHTKLPRSPAEICQALQHDGLPRLWIPSSDDFILVESLPILPTGKLDLLGVRRIAESKASGGGIEPTTQAEHETISPSA